MNKERLSELLINNIDNISDPYFYKNILKKNNNLIRFDIVNRMLIEIQYRNAYDVRTEEEWLCNGRVIIKNQKPIFIATPKYVTKYIDNTNGNIIDNEDLTLDEISKALEYNIIRKETDIQSMVISSVYDIRQTHKSNNINTYKLDKIHVKYSSIIKLFQNITNCSIEESEVTYYHKKANILEICRDDYKNFSQTMCDIIVQYYMDNKIIDLIKDTNILKYDELSEYNFDLIRESLKYCIDTLFNLERNSDFDIIRHTQIDRILGILNIIDSIMYEIVDNFNACTSIHKGSIAREIDVAKRAERLLSIMEANSISYRVMQS